VAPDEVERPAKPKSADRYQPTIARRHDDRLLSRLRRDGLRCFMIELRETEIDALIRKGLLPPGNRHDYDSVQSAL